MNAWRVIFTDSESMTGIAPVCDRPDVHAMQHGEGPDSPSVYDDCCPHPHIECWSESTAENIAKQLTMAEAKVCS